MPGPRQLAQIQRALKRVLVHPAGLRESPVRDFLREQPPISRLKRMGIYRYAIHQRFDDALAEDFPVCRIFMERLEAGLFHALGREYRLRHPSAHFNLSRFTHAFPTFIARRRARLARYPFLPELARVEWAMVDAFFSALGPPLDGAAIAALSPEARLGACVVLDRSVRLLETEWPVGEIFNSERAAAKPRASWILVHRGLDGLIYVETLSRPQFRLLRAFARGCSLARAAAGLDAREVPRVMGWFNDWTAGGIIRGLRVEPPRAGRGRRATSR